jgi:hypothetical protein
MFLPDMPLVWGTIALNMPNGWVQIRIGKAILGNGLKRRKNNSEENAQDISTPPKYDNRNRLTNRRCRKCNRYCEKNTQKSNGEVPLKTLQSKTTLQISIEIEQNLQAKVYIERISINNERIFLPQKE